MSVAVAPERISCHSSVILTVHYNRASLPNSYKITRDGGGDDVILDEI